MTHIESSAAYAKYTRRQEMLRLKRESMARSRAKQRENKPPVKMGRPPTYKPPPPTTGNQAMDALVERLYAYRVQLRRCRRDLTDDQDRHCLWLITRSLAAFVRQKIDPTEDDIRSLIRDAAITCREVDITRDRAERSATFAKDEPWDIPAYRAFVIETTRIRPDMPTRYDSKSDD